MALTADEEFQHQLLKYILILQAHKPLTSSYNSDGSDVKLPLGVTGEVEVNTASCEQWPSEMDSSGGSPTPSYVTL